MKSSRHMAGFSLTELLVAVTIGLVILAGASSVMVSSKKTYTAQDSLARLQENARAAMLMLTHDIRNVGYWGCNPDKNGIVSTLPSAASGANPAFSYRNSLEGYEAGFTNFLPSGVTIGGVLSSGYIRPGTDAIWLRGLDTGNSIRVAGPMPSAASSLKVAASAALVAGEVIAVTDCNKTSIFQVTGVNDLGGGTHEVEHVTGSMSPGNTTGSLIKTFDTEAHAMRYVSNLYYIDTGASGEPSLFRQTITNTGTAQPQELVEGIENLQVLYGVDTTGDLLPDTYRKANLVTAASWSNVKSIRFGIVARALANLQTTDIRTANAATASQMDTKALDVDGDGTPDFLGTETTDTITSSGKTVKDRQYDRRVFRTTVFLRNRL